MSDGASQGYRDANPIRAKDYAAMSVDELSIQIHKTWHASGGLESSAIDQLARRAREAEAQKEEDFWMPEVLDMIAERLEALDKSMGGTLRRSPSPPMNYNDWISCCVAKARKQGARRALLEAADGIMAQEGPFRTSKCWPHGSLEEIESWLRARAEKEEKG